MIIVLDNSDVGSRYEYIRVYTQAILETLRTLLYLIFF